MVGEENFGVLTLNGGVFFCHGIRNIIIINNILLIIIVNNIISILLLIIIIIVTILLPFRAQTHKLSQSAFSRCVIHSSEMKALYTQYS